MSGKKEIIKAIRAEFVKIAKIDQDAETIYEQVDAQLRLHTSDPIVLSPTSGDARKMKYLAESYQTGYLALSALLEQLDEEQQRAYTAKKK